MTRSSDSVTTDSSENSCSRPSMTPERAQRKSQIIHQLKTLRANVESLERELSRVELGLPEPFKFGDDWVPPFIRRGYEAGSRSDNRDQRARELGDDRGTDGHGA